MRELRAALVALMLVWLAACEPCWAMPVHVERCEHGDAASCSWLLDNLDATTGRCEVRP